MCIRDRSQWDNLSFNAPKADYSILSKNWNTLIDCLKPLIKISPPGIKHQLFQVICKTLISIKGREVFNTLMTMLNELREHWQYILRIIEEIYYGTGSTYVDIEKLKQYMDDENLDIKSKIIETIGKIYMGTADRIVADILISKAVKNSDDLTLKNLCLRSVLWIYQGKEDKLIELLRTIKETYGNIGLGRGELRDYSVINRPYVPLYNSIAPFVRNHIMHFMVVISGEEKIIEEMLRKLCDIGSIEYMEEASSDTLKIYRYTYPEKIATTDNEKKTLEVYFLYFKEEVIHIPYQIKISGCQAEKEIIDIINHEIKDAQTQIGEQYINIKMLLTSNK